MSKRHQSARVTRGRPLLAEVAVDALTREIVTGEFEAGEVLPSTNQLETRFGVSRTVIRDVITTLTEKGLVVPRQGIGTVVLSREHWNILDPMVLDSLFLREDRVKFLDDVVAVRATLESAMARDAANRMTPELASELVQHMEYMATILDKPQELAEADVDFHAIIHRASDNAIGSAIVTVIQGQARTVPEYSGAPTIEDSTRTHEAHASIVSALVKGDAEASSKAMYRHITESWNRRRPKEAQATVKNEPSV